MSRRRVEVDVELATGIPRQEIVRSGDRLGLVEIVRTEGNAWAVTRLGVAMPWSWTPAGDLDDFRETSTALDLVRQEFGKRGWKVNGLTARLARRL